MALLYFALFRTFLNLLNYSLTQEKRAELVGVSTHHIAIIERARSFSTPELMKRLKTHLQKEAKK